MKTDLYSVIQANHGRTLSLCAGSSMDLLCDRAIDIPDDGTSVVFERQWFTVGVGVACSVRRCIRLTVLCWKLGQKSHKHAEKASPDRQLGLSMSDSPTNATIHIYEAASLSHNVFQLASNSVSTPSA